MEDALQPPSSSQDGDRIGLDALGGGGLAWEGAGTMSLGPDVDITDL